MKIILLGSPGVGKGTYASFIKEKYKIPHISTGDLFREALKNGTPLGLKAKGYMEAGALVPDELTIQILSDRIKNSDCQGGFMLDGFPRTIAQAEALEKIAKIDVVINFFASDQVIMQRLGGRIICKNCGEIFNTANRKPKKPGICDKCQGELYQRADEKPEIIKQRLDIYRQQTKPLEDYYRNKGILKEVRAETDMNDATFKEDILDKIDDALSGLN